MQRSIPGTVNSAAVNHDEVNAAEINALERSLDELIADLNAIASDSLSEFPLETAQHIREAAQFAVDALLCPDDLFRAVTPDSATPGTGDVTIHFEVTDRFDRLMTALNTINRHFSAVQIDFHSSSPDSLDSVRLAGTGEGSQ